MSSPEFITYFMTGSSARRCVKCGGTLSWNGKGYLCLQCAHFVPDPVRPPGGKPKPPKAQ
jgi:hypothetical protein